jgi:uncharacterized protein YdiU (UPF0061 family)
MDAQCVVDELWEEIEPLLRMARGDWTLFWRQLTYVAARYSPAAKSKRDRDGPDDCASDYDDMMTLLLGEGGTYPFYDALTDDNRNDLRRWIEKWHVALTTCYRYAAGKAESFASPPEEIMRLANPKYTLQEWMLVEAYSKADPGGDYSGVHELFGLILRIPTERAARMILKSIIAVLPTNPCEREVPRLCLDPCKRVFESVVGMGASMIFRDDF